MDKEKIGNLIYELRTNQNLTQKDLSEKLNVSIQAISKWERGLGLPDIALFKPLSEFLNISIIELMNGQRMEKDIDKGKVDKTILETVSMNNKAKRKLKLVFGVIIAIILVISLVMTQYFVNNKSKDNKELCVGFESKVGINVKSDGWLEILEISYICDGSINYSFSGKNLKYRFIEGYGDTELGIDEDGNEVTLYPYAHPQYLDNPVYSVDFYAINNYLNTKKFKGKIGIEDLRGLDLNYLDKQEFMELFNKVIASPINNSWGPYSFYPESDLIESKQKEYTWTIGYYISRGNIMHVDIELIYKDGKHLSKLVDDKLATSIQKQLADTVDNLEIEIVKKNRFAIFENTDKPLNSLAELLKEIDYSN